MLWRIKKYFNLQHENKFGIFGSLEDHKSQYFYELSDKKKKPLKMES